MTALSRRLGAEALGTALLVCAVVGSGIMAARLAGGNGALALLGNTLATGAMLVVLIQTFEPVSGAHFNPVVTLAFLCLRAITPAVAGLYVAFQIIGGILGVAIAHAMFDLPLWQVSRTVRDGWGQVLAEAVATFGLVLVIIRCGWSAPAAVPHAVGLYIAAAYWFTASTSFANPAVTIARALSDSFSGIAPAGIAPFVVAQVLGGLVGLFIAVILGRPQTQEPRG